VRADWFAPALAAHVPRLADAYRIERRLASQDRVALTFDDGPHAQGTPAVLEALARGGASATAFEGGLGSAVNFPRSLSFSKESFA